MFASRATYSLTKNSVPGTWIFLLNCWSGMSKRLLKQCSTSIISHDPADGLGPWIKLGITLEDKRKKEIKAPPLYKKLHTFIGLNVKYFIHKWTYSMKQNYPFKKGYSPSRESDHHRSQQVHCRFWAALSTLTKQGSSTRKVCFWQPFFFQICICVGFQVHWHVLERILHIRPCGLTSCLWAGYQCSISSSGRVWTACLPSGIYCYNSTFELLKRQRKRTVTETKGTVPGIVDRYEWEWSSGDTAGMTSTVQGNISVKNKSLRNVLTV